MSKIKYSYYCCSSLVPGEVEGYSNADNVDRDVLLAEAISEIVIKVFDGDNAGLWQRQRGDASIALIRQISMYLVHVVCCRNFTQIGVVFKRDRTTVSHACCVVEDRRDCQEFDRVLDVLEFGILCLLDSGFYLEQSETGERKLDEAGY